VQPKSRRVLQHQAGRSPRWVLTVRTVKVYLEVHGHPHQCRNDNAPAVTQRGRFEILERETGIEPATLSLGSAYRVPVPSVHERP